MTRKAQFVGRAAVVSLVAAAALACGGGGNGSPTSPTPGGGSSGGGSGGGGSVSTTTMTISASGVLTPNDITVAVGSRVTITNNHNRNHEMNSDPHPEHSDCPALNDIGFLSPQQSKTSGNLTVARTCGIHDHNDPANSSLRGVIRIQ